MLCVGKMKYKIWLVFLYCLGSWFQRYTLELYWTASALLAYMPNLSACYLWTVQHSHKYVSSQACYLHPLVSFCWVSDRISQNILPVQTSSAHSLNEWPVDDTIACQMLAFKGEFSTKAVWIGVGLQPNNILKINFTHPSYKN